MKAVKLVSIIVPVYNKKLWLSNCVNSILCQTYLRIEIILVDDGSTDDSGAVCDYFASLDNRVIVIHTSNVGVSSARNIGIEVSKGEYIAFIDADDYVETTYIEHLMQYEGYDLVVNSYQKEPREYLDNNIVHYVDLFGRSLWGTSPWGKIYNSDIIKKFHIKFDVKEHFGEDTLFNLLYLRYCKSIMIIPYNEYNYRVIGPVRYSLSKKEIVNKIELLRNAYCVLGKRFNYDYDISYDIRMTISIFPIKEILQKGDSAYFSLYKKYFPSKSIQDLYYDNICSPLYRSISWAKDEAIVNNYIQVKSILKQTTVLYAKEFRRIEIYPYIIHRLIGKLLGFHLQWLAFLVLIGYCYLKKFKK